MVRTFWLTDKHRNLGRMLALCELLAPNENKSSATPCGIRNDMGISVSFPGIASVSMSLNRRGFRASEQSSATASRRLSGARSRKLVELTIRKATHWSGVAFAAPPG
jgi:hypothetical protein